MKITSRTMNKFSTSNLFITILSFLLILNSCGTVEPCQEAPAMGNAGGLFNTPLDEHSPRFYDNSLYYTALLNESGEAERIMRSEFEAGEFKGPEIAIDLPLQQIQNSGLPTFFYNEKTGITELYFAGTNTSSGRINRDIYFSEFVNNEWTPPIRLNENINTNKYESHPAISLDGNMLIFASDREGGVGGIDLYISLRNENGFWDKAENLTISVNTDKNEMAPYFDNSRNLYYSSNGYQGLGGSDIIKAKMMNDNGKFGDPKILNFPINTDGDETGAAPFGSKIFVSSNRRGGCGGMDLYEFDMCGPVVLEVNISSNSASTPLEGKLYLENRTQNIEREYDIDESGFTRINLTAGNDYEIAYYNSCTPSFIPRQVFTAPCSDSNVIKLISEFVIPNTSKEFDFENYKIPFFVTGYYYPNTEENLQSLRLKFQYNMIENTDETAYIHNPGPEYDQYALEVQKALDDASNFIFKVVQELDDNCGNSDSRLKITVTGYSDPRAISNMAKYVEEEINDTNWQIFVSKGQQMNNELLSKLRAYYTAKYIESSLGNNQKYLSVKDRISWNIKGMGVDQESDIENKFKRRVNIEIEMENAEI